MSRYDAERALSIYKTFTKQTNLVVEFLSIARQYENATRLEIPKLKHAPTSLTSSLEEYLNDPEFEVNRRQYLAQQDAKKGKKSGGIKATESSNNFVKSPINKGSSSKDFPEPKTVQAAPPPKQDAKGPTPDLIDFFDSIEQNQQPMASAPTQQQSVPNFGVGPQYQQQMQLQQTGVLPQQQPTFFAPNYQSPQQSQLPNNGGFGSSNPFGQPQVQQSSQQDFTNTGLGGYSQPPLMQQQDAYPGIQQSNGSPFPTQQDAFSSMPQNNGSQFPQQQQPFLTGPKGSHDGQQSFGTPQRSMTTGSSNPFRQSAMNTGTSLTSYSTNTSVNAPSTPHSSNPFARSLADQSTGQTSKSLFSTQPTGGSPFTSPPPPQPQQQQQAQVSSPLTPQKTGTNPFARSNTLPPNSDSPFAPVQQLTSTPTGGTNPFRQSMFTNQQTGQGWQAGQGTMGGFEQLPTVPIFPRPGQLQQQPQTSWPG